MLKVWRGVKVYMQKLLQNSYKKDLKTLIIRFDIVMILTSNLENILHMSKDIRKRKHVDVSKIFDAPKTIKIKFVFFGAPLWVYEFSYSCKNLNLC